MRINLSKIQKDDRMDNAMEVENQSQKVKVENVDVLSTDLNVDGATRSPRKRQQEDVSRPSHNENEIKLCLRIDSVFIFREDCCLR